MSVHPDSEPFVRAFSFFLNRLRELARRYTRSTDFSYIHVDVIDRKFVLPFSDIDLFDSNEILNLFRDILRGLEIGSLCIFRDFDGGVSFSVEGQNIVMGGVRISALSTENRMIDKKFGICYIYIWSTEVPEAGASLYKIEFDFYQPETLRINVHYTRGVSSILFEDELQKVEEFLKQLHGIIFRDNH